MSHLRRSSLAAVLLSAAGVAHAQIDVQNWGRVTTPVFGTSESGAYSGAELFAGPMKFGAAYFNGILPNGRIVRPAGASIQIGMNPLGCALTPDGKYLITTNDDERDAGASFVSLLNPTNQGSYSISVVDTSTMMVVSQANAVGRFFIGLQVSGNGPYKIWASGGADQNVKVFNLSAAGVINPVSANIAISPITPKDAGFVSSFTPVSTGLTIPGAVAGGPSGGPSVGSTAGGHITFPAGSALSGHYLYVACNGDNSVAVIDTSTNTVVKQVPAGYFPYGVAVGNNGDIAVSNWGITEYKFLNPTYDPSGNLSALGFKAGAPDGFYVPPTSISGAAPKTSSISLYQSGATLTPNGAVYLGQPGGIDATNLVGDTHPSAMAIVRKGQGVMEVLFVAKTNSDSLGVIQLQNGHRLDDVDLSPVGVTLADGHQVHGAYPNAIVVSPDNNLMFVGEAGLNSVAVLDTHNPVKPKLLGRIPTGWYPTGLALSPDGRSLYVINAKGIGEDLNSNTVSGPHSPTGIESFTDGNFIFGTAQKINVDDAVAHLDNSTVLGYNYAVNANADASVVPVGGTASGKIKHVIFILHENKTFDSMLGNLGSHFGTFSSTMFNARGGAIQTDAQFTPVSLNTQMLAGSFATAVNYYSDSEESDAGHQFCMSGTASDYTEKTLLVKGGRGMLVNKNFEPEDYPEGGYIFNNAARHGVTFKEYGIEAARTIGSDTGSLKPASLNDPTSGNAGYPTSVSPLTNVGDVDSATQGVGHGFFMKFPGLAVLGTANPGGEPRIDLDYPGYNLHISDQPRATHFIADFDRMLAAGTLPKFIYLYEPSDHTGTPFVATNVPAPTGAEQVADGDVGLGMVVKHIMNSPAYYDAASGTGSAIFITYDDAQSTRDHIHEHRTPMMVVSPFAKSSGVGQGFVAKRHYSTASVVKTEELLLGIPPNNLGDLFATDLRDMFQATYNGITAADLTFNPAVVYKASPEGRKIWALAKNLDLSGPDRDSRRLGALNHLSMQADALHAEAVRKHHLKGKDYLALQSRLLRLASNLTSGPAPRDSDD